MTMHASKGKATPASAATKRAVVKTVRACLTEAVKRGHIDKNPARYVALPPAEENVPEPLTTEEIRALVQVCQHRRNGARWLVAFASGLRQSEALGLQWPDVDFDQSTITIRRTLTRPVWRHGCGTKPECGASTARKCPKAIAPPRTGSAKTTGSHRTIVLDDVTLAEMKRHRRHQQEERMRFPLPWPEEEWVFTNQMGGPLDHRSDSRQWRTLLRDAGVRQVRLHDARHTAATMLLVQG